LEEKMCAIIRPLTEADLRAALRIVRTAFGTFVGAPDPENFWADLDCVYGRFAAEHVVGFAAKNEPGRGRGAGVAVGAISER
jgi:hypothetical protein